MYKNSVDNILYGFSIIFIIGSIYVNTFANKLFEWKMLFGTDGLTLLGLIFTLISMISMKVKFIRKWIAWLLLTLNISNMDYRVETILVCPASVTITELVSLFKKSVSSSGLYKHDSYDTNRNSISIYKIYHRGMAANVLIQKLDNVDDLSENSFDHFEHNFWKVSIDGVSQFRIMEKNNKFLINNYLEALLKVSAIPTKLSLIVSNKSSEFNLADKGILLDTKKFSVKYSEINIASVNSTKIIIASDTGLSLSAENKGDFSNGLDIIKNIMIS